MTSSLLASFHHAALAACAAQFPRRCPACKRVHRNFRDFLETTRTVGSPKLDPDDDEHDAIGLLSFVNCACGSTLALRYEDVTQHAAFNRAVRHAMAQSGRSDTELLTELVSTVNAMAKAGLVEPSLTTQPMTTHLEMGAAMVAILARANIEIPPFPAVAFKIAELARAPNSSADQIAKALSSDATLAARLLQLVNTPLYARGQTITSLPAAVTRVGLREVSRLAITAGIGATTSRPGALASVRLNLWHRSVTMATVARALGAHRGLVPDESFLCGLLQPLGSIVGTLSLEVFLAENPAFASHSMSWWLRVLELFRSELGALTASRWKLPPTLTEVIRSASGAEGDGPARPMLEVVRAAAEVARVSAEVDEITEESLGHLTMLEPAERALMVKVLPQSAEAIASFEEGSANKPAPSRVLPANPEAQAPLAKEVWVVNLRRREERFRVVAFATHAIVLDGPQPLPEGVLAHFEANAQPPLPFFASTRSCVAVGDGYRLVCAPFAFSSDTHRRWRALVAGP
jgi:HD-like signal output (HDOD) protein